MKNKIPKIIHYCWFGRNPEPELMKKCLESWKKYLPDYRLMLWNEDNFDLNANQFVRQAYDEKKWAFVTDYVRFYALYHFGGVYMDTDVEVLRNLDDFLQHSAFTGFENEVLIPTGIIGSIPEHRWVDKIKEYYEEREFINEDGSLEVKPNTLIITELTSKFFDLDITKTFQILADDLVIYPKEYFCPKSYYDNKIVLTDNTYTIHHFSGSWHRKRDRFKLKLHRIFIFLFGKSTHDFMIKKRHSK